MQSIARHILHVERVIVKFVDDSHVHVLLRLTRHHQQMCSNAGAFTVLASDLVGSCPGTQILLSEHLN